MLATAHRPLVRARRVLFTTASVGAALAAGGRRGGAQQTGSPLAPAPQTYPNIRVTGRVQSQAYWFDNHDVAATVGPESNFLMRRVRIEARGNLTENVSFVIAPSFEGGRAVDLPRARGGIRLRDAFVDVRLTTAGAPTAFTLRMGQEKRPFGRYELTSSTNLPSIERGTGRGLVAGQSTNDLFEASGFLAHDVGASALLTMGRERFALRVGVYNGQGESAQDVNDSKSVGARATYAITRKLNVGGAFSYHDFVMAPANAGTTPDSGAHTHAFNLDAQWGAIAEPGLYAMVDLMDGQLPIAARPEVRGVNAVAAWHVRVGRPGLVWAWEPVLRVDRSDPNLNADDNGETILAAGLGIYLNPRTHFRAMFERQSFGSAVGVDPIAGVRTQLALSF